VQQNIAQPRQVRKEATVGKQLCVTQGSLTSFFNFQNLQPPPMAQPPLAIGKRYKQYVQALLHHYLYHWFDAL
jgi:hypothetical protein